MATEVALARDEGDALELGEDLGDDGSGNEDGCAAKVAAWCADAPAHSAWCEAAKVL